MPPVLWQEPRKAQGISVGLGLQEAAKVGALAFSCTCRLGNKICTLSRARITLKIMCVQAEGISIVRCAAVVGYIEAGDF